MNKKRYKEKDIMKFLFNIYGKDNCAKETYSLSIYS
mgnify:FL=1